MLGDLYNLVARTVEFIHRGLGPIFGQESFASWALSIVLLVMGVRLLLVPAFIKQIKSQRQMALMQPKIAELRKKYGNDKQQLNQEMMKLQQEHGNPLLGCLPMLIQIPLFLALFRVMNGMTATQLKTQALVTKATELSAAGVGKSSQWICPDGTALNSYCYKPSHSLAADIVQNIANAKAFGVSISAAFMSPSSLLDFLNANGTAVKITTALLIVTMTASTYLSTSRSFKRNPAPTEPTQIQMQKLMLYLGPGFLFLFGFNFPVGVLLYWLTTNLWTLGQQEVIFRKMGPNPVVGAPGSTPTGPPPKKSLLAQAQAQAQAQAAQKASSTNASASTTTASGSKRKSKSVGEMPVSFGNVVQPPVYRQRTVQKKKKKR